MSRFAGKINKLFLVGIFVFLFVIVGAYVAWASCADVCLDFDGDGYGNPASDKCDFLLLDCDDTNPNVNQILGNEVCDGGIDEDCDGLVDCDDIDDCSGYFLCLDGIDCVNGTSMECGSDIGECSKGLSLCINNKWQDCSDVKPTAEVCDGLDNNCNGTVDDGLIGDLADKQDGVCSGIRKVCDKGNGWIEPNYAEAVNVIYGSYLYEANETLCDNYDNDCDGVVNDGLGPEECGVVCTDLDSNYSYDSNRVGNLRCCGNDANEGTVGKPFNGAENFYSLLNSCADGRDNDCDGKIDKVAGNEDSDCLATCFGASSPTEAFVYVASRDPECNQCSYEGDNDGNQSYTDTDWSAYPGMADQCDKACNPSLNATVHIDDYEHGNELDCDDNKDNDCDGMTDCADVADCEFASNCCTATCAGVNQPNCQSISHGLSNVDSASGVCCAANQVCLECASGFEWNGSSCEPACVDNCSTFANSRCGMTGTVPSNAIVSGSGVCCTAGETCYVCEAGHVLNAGVCECVNTCSGNAGCSTSVIADANQISGECCGGGDCYNCINTYTWDSVSGTCVPPCVDADGDGYSSSGGGNCCGTTGNQPCNSAPDGNDNDDTVHPGAEELCDGKDNDLSDSDPADEGCDSDNDGYCDNGMTYVNNFPALTSPCQETTDNGGLLDCNDEDVNVHPINTENCDNSGVDDDCDGYSDCDDSECNGNVACISYCTFPIVLPCQFP